MMENEAGLLPALAGFSSQPLQALVPSLQRLWFPFFTGFVSQPLQALVPCLYRLFSSAANFSYQLLEAWFPRPMLQISLCTSKQVCLGLKLLCFSTFFKENKGPCNSHDPPNWQFVWLGYAFQNCIWPRKFKATYKFHNKKKSRGYKGKQSQLTIFCYFSNPKKE